MYLVHILLPWQPDGDQAMQQQRFARERDELVRRFGGVTAYSRAPAKGLWRDDESGVVVPDDIVVLEVMTPTLDESWWADHRADLERRFEQDEIVVRAHPVRRL
ncbi:MAG TPA: hypothetical protein VEA81_03785 [Burkholderiaceae bacterium]|nr:hypothetical protein [Burkholderiaceae bacterium]